MTFINESGLAMNVIDGLTSNITGNIYMTFLLIMVFLLVLALIFRLPLQLLSAILIPYVIMMSAYDSLWYPITAMVLIFVAINVIYFMATGKT